MSDRSPSSIERLLVGARHASASRRSQCASVTFFTTAGRAVRALSRVASPVIPSPVVISVTSVSKRRSATVRHVRDMDHRVIHDQRRSSLAKVRNQNAHNRIYEPPGKASPRRPRSERRSRTFLRRLGLPSSLLPERSCIRQRSRQAGHESSHQRRRVPFGESTLLGVLARHEHLKSIWHYVHVVGRAREARMRPPERAPESEAQQMSCGSSRSSRCDPPAERPAADVRRHPRVEGKPSAPCVVSISIASK